MNNKNFFDDTPINLIGPDKHKELIMKRNNQCSLNNSGMVTARNVNTGETIRIDKVLFHESKDLVGITKGYGGEHLRDTISVKDKYGNIVRISKDKFKDGEYVGSTAGKTTFKDKSGNKIFTTIDDPRVVSGELVGVSKGNTFKNPNSRGQMVHTNIYNQHDEIVYQCYGNYKETCKNNHLPQKLLSRTIKENNSITKTKKYSNYIGWYARKIK